DLEHRGAVCAFAQQSGIDFESMCHEFLSHVPDGTPVTYINARDDQAHEQIIAALNGGPYLANYTGHSVVGSWGPAGFFSIADVPQLVNGDHPSIYTMLLCLQGYFIRPVSDSLAEAIIKAPSGAGAAVWASTVDVTPEQQLRLGNRFYARISSGDI